MQIPEGRYINFVINGIIALTLSLVIWKLTQNWWAWFVLAAPGGALTIYGTVMIFMGHE